MSMPDFSLKGEIAIVTGARRGIGKAIALAFAGAGADVAVCDIVADDGQLDSVAGDIKKMGRRALTVKVDTTKRAEVEAMARSVTEGMGPISILANNAGILIRSSLLDLAEEDWDRILAVNLKSMFLTCRHVLPHMERQGRGVIVNIASINAIRSLPAIAIAYAASKAGVIALTREVAMQYAAKGIRANAILPGLLDTPMVKAQLVGAYGGDVPGMLQRRAALCPSGRQGDAWDTAHAALFLASDEACYITATTLVVDGGLTAWIAAGAA